MCITCPYCVKCRLNHVENIRNKMVDTDKVFILCHIHIFHKMSLFFIKIIKFYLNFVQDMPSIYILRIVTKVKLF
jgi:hypothetical protein